MYLGSGIGRGDQTFLARDVRGQAQESPTHGGGCVAGFAGEFSRAQLRVPSQPLVEVRVSRTRAAVSGFERSGFAQILLQECLQGFRVQKPGIHERFDAERVGRASDGQRAISELLELKEGKHQAKRL